MKLKQKIGMLFLMFAPLALFGAKSVLLPALPCGELPNSVRREGLTPLVE